MIEDAISLAGTLNDLSLGRVNAAVAEAAIRDDERPHHVADPDGVLGLDPLAGTPLRLALAAVEGLGLTTWRLCLPRPGRPGGLRGPASVTVDAIDCGAAVVDQSGRCWLPRPVGEAMQWSVMAANPPLAAPQPGEAAQLLNEAILDAERSLTRLDARAGQRPEPEVRDWLGEHYPRRNHQLLRQALGLHRACEAALEASSDVLTSHAVGVREAELRRLDEACLTAIEAAVSHPL